MKLSALLAVSALLFEGIVAYTCKERLNYCGRSIKLKNSSLRDEDYQDNDLVKCLDDINNEGSGLSLLKTCDGGCVEAPAGQSDTCAPSGGFEINESTKGCVRGADNAHKESSKRAEKKAKSDSELEVMLKEADWRFFARMAHCMLFSAGENKEGSSGHDLFKHTLNFYAETADRLKAEWLELKKEQQN